MIMMIVMIVMMINKSGRCGEEWGLVSRHVTDWLSEYLLYKVSADFNIKEYDQPGLVISIKLTRWHNSSKVKCSLPRKKSGQVLKNFLPAFLVVLTSYSSLYFLAVSIDARGTFTLLATSPSFPTWWSLTYESADASSSPCWSDTFVHPSIYYKPNM